MNIGERIRQLRRERDWTQGELAERVGILSQNIARYELGKSIPRKQMMQKFAKAFEMTTDELQSEAKARNFQFEAQDPELAKLFNEIVSMGESDREAVKRVLTLVVKQNRIQQVMAS